jgi:hypothetical protein
MRWFVLTTAACLVAVLVFATTPKMVFASPWAGGGTAPALVNLRVDPSAARRILAADEGASQENDTEKPKAMEDQAAPKATGKVAEPPPESKFAFVKDWPFWVIVGGVVVASVATYMLVKNANDTPPCGARYTAGCFGAR